MHLACVRTRAKGRAKMTASSAKSALVTGACGGIGRAVARSLARDGFSIAVHYVSNPDKAKELAAEIRSVGVRAIIVQADIADTADVERLFKETLFAFDTLDVVVNSAGTMPMLPISGGNVESFDRVVATNLRGCFLVMG